MFKNFLEIPFKPVKSDKIYWKFMGRLITVSNNDSGSNAKAKISFDIKNVKKTADTEGEPSAKPVSYTHLDVYKRQLHRTAVSRRRWRSLARGSLG